jgi:TonB family protein
MQNHITRLSTLICILLILSHTVANAQTDFCEEKASGVYWPVKTEVKRYYMSPQGISLEYYDGDSLQADGKTYYKRITESKADKSKNTYLREQDGNVYIYDTEKKLEFLELSGNITPGYTWNKYDESWKYTVVDTISAITTPYCEFKNLLNIKAEPMGETAKQYDSYFNLYYKRGVGLVDLHVSGKGYSFLTIDKTSVIEKNWTAIGCEDLKTEEKRAKCTATKIKEFVNEQYNYKGELKKGIIAISFEIDEQGNVADASIVKTIDGADGQAAEALRVVKLMKFIPREINGKPYKTRLTYPFAF